MSPARRPAVLLGAALVVVAASMPFVLSGFRLFQFTQVFIYAIALELADHAYVLETGRVVLAGPPAILKQDDAVRRSYLGY